MEQRILIPSYPEPVRDRSYLIDINPKPYAKMFYYASHAIGEISGYFKVRRPTSSHFIVTDLIIRKQWTTQGYTEISSEEMSKFLTSLAMRNQPIEEWLGWWHSHASFGTFWSRTDKENIETHNQGDLSLALEINKRGSLIGRIDFFQPERLAITPDIRILPAFPNLQPKIRKQINRLVAYGTEGESEFEDGETEQYDG